jgi:hypothetical protein
MKKPKTPAVPVQDAVSAAVAAATALRGIGGQELLADPLLNPASRPLAEELRTEELRASLHTAHAAHTARQRTAASVQARRDRVAEAAAADAERAAQVIRTARAASAPGTRVLALRRGRQLYARAALGASTVLAAGAAYGLGDIVAHIGGHAPMGWAVELALTGVSAGAIGYRSHLAAHDAPVEKERRDLLQRLATWPLAVSVTLALTGVAIAVTGIVAGLGVGVGLAGALCAVGSGVTGWAAHLITDTSSAAITTVARQVDDADLAALDAVAMATVPPPVPAPLAPVADALIPTGRREDDDGQEEGAVPVRPETVDAGTAHAEHIRQVAAAAVPEDGVAEEVEAWLRGRDDDGDDGDGDGGARGPHGPVPAPAAPVADDGGEATERLVPRGASPADLGVPRGASPQARRPRDAAEGQVLLLAYVREYGREATVRGAARELDVDPRTVRRYRDALAAQGHDVAVLYRSTAA